jgi:hypothetical protein
MNDKLGGHTINVGAPVGHDAVVLIFFRILGILHGNDVVRRDSRSDEDR